MQVPVNNIDLSSENYDRYLFSYGRDLNAITDSISKVGLINPVTLNKSHELDEVYSIVCGYQRIMSCQKLGIKEVEAKVVEEHNDAELSLQSLHDNLFSRGFNEIEKAIVIKRFLEIGYSCDRLMSEIHPLSIYHRTRVS